LAGVAPDRVRLNRGIFSNFQGGRSVGLFDFRPTRQQAQAERMIAPPEEAVMVADIDKLLTHRVSFKWAGKVHYINPVSTETMLRFMEETARLNFILQQGRKRDVDGPTDRDFYEQYARVFALLCSSLTLEDVKNMTPLQVGAVMNIMKGCISGEVFEQTEEQLKKKTMELAPAPPTKS
jgi:hypothetical protein